MLKCSHISLYESFDIAPNILGLFKLKWSQIENESVPKILINNTINLILKTAICILLISNYDSFRVLSDKIASVYFISKNVIFIVYHRKWPAQGTSTVPIVSAHFRSL